MGKTDILEIVNSFSISDRLRLVEEILRTIREEEVTDIHSGNELLEFAGIISEKEAKEMKTAVAESRKLDLTGYYSRESTPPGYTKLSARKYIRRP